MVKRTVHRPREFTHKSVRNRSSRNGVKPRLIVLHTTESHNRDGRSDIQAIWNWFDNPSAQASSHVIVDREGRGARCVPDAEKAWTQAFYNSLSLSVEQVGFASESKTAWLKNNRAGLKKTAKYIAYWSKEHDIPIRRGKVSPGGSVIRSGVLGHADLGSLGGGHHDPGTGFPWTIVLALAKYYKKFGWR